MAFTHKKNPKKQNETKQKNPKTLLWKTTQEISPGWKNQITMT